MGRTLERAKPRGEYLLRVPLLILAVAVCVPYLVFAATHYQVDFGVYRAGGLTLLHGRDLYALRVPPIGLPFTYPPAAAVLFTPFSWVPARPGQFVWVIVSLIALWYVVRLTLRRYATPRVGASFSIALAVFAVVAHSNPLHVGLALGQINPIIALLVLADLCGVFPRLPRGCMIGVATALKLTPGFLVLYFLAVRRYRDAAYATATFFAVSIVAFAFAPGASIQYWLDRYFADARRTGGVNYISNQSVNGVLVRKMHGVLPAKPWWMLAAVAITVLVLVLVRRIEPRRPWLAEAVAMATMLLVSPVSWIHHWVIVLPFLVAAIRFCSEEWTRWRIAICAFVVTLSLLLYRGVIWWVPHEHGREDALRFGQFLLGNSAVFLLLALVIAVGVTAARQPNAARNLAARGAAT